MVTTITTIKRIPPNPVREGLERLGIAIDEIELSVATDLRATQSSSSQWLVVAARALLVFEPRQGDLPVAVHQLERIQEFRNVPGVGSGILQIRIEGIWIDLLKYSNRARHVFDNVKRHLELLSRGENLLPSGSEDADPRRCPECGLMLEFAGERCPRCIDHGAALQRVLGMMKPYWRSAAVLMLCLGIGIGLDMAWPLLTRFLVDYVLTPGKTPPFAWVAGRSPTSLLILVVAGLAGVQMARGVLNLLTGRISSRVGNALTFDVRARLVRKLEELGLAYYSKQETGSLVGRIAYDTDAIQSFMSQMTSGFFMQFLLVIISFAMMLSLEPTLALWAMVPAPFIIGGAFIYWRYVHPHFQRYWDRSSKQAGILSGILSGIRVVKAFAQEENEFQRFQSASRNVRESKDTLDRTAAYFYPLMAVVFQIGGWIIWYVGGHDVLSHKISLGTLMAFFGYLSMFYGPLGNLTNLTTWLTQFSTQVHRIFEILDTPTVLPDAPQPIAAPHSRGEIEFRDVTFGYSRGVPIIRNLSFKIRPGMKIGIVGRSGSGKTSLINLLCRFYDVDSGQILIDGVDIRNMSKDDLRARISMVLQEPFLFKGSLTENIAYGRPHATPEQVIAASRAACSHDFVLQHHLAYDTSVGERGQELSGGERQRISIARALLCEPPILILDEATSSIDTESELAIQDALSEIARDRTTLIIAHRLSTLQNCDQLLVIEGGQIAEAGTHRELMNLDGRYAHWVRIQQGEMYIEMDADGKAINERAPSRMIPAGSLPPLISHHPRWLRPATDRIERGGEGELQLQVPGEPAYRGIFALRCFPISHPFKYLSLRHVGPDGRVAEIGLIRDLSEWPQHVRDLLIESLERRYFFHTVEKIVGIRKIAQFLAVSAKTDQGEVEFIMRHAPEAAPEYGGTGKLLMDVEDNLYIIPSTTALPRAERELFERYIYW